MKTGRISLPDLGRRYLRLYTGVVADILDTKGIRAHSLPESIRPMKDVMKVAGPAFTRNGSADRGLSERRYADADPNAGSYCFWPL